MKHTHLSNFQKQQYTAYLESHLQKFSSFMLAQKKENEHHQQFYDTLTQQSHLIQQLQQKVQTLDLYQNQIIKNQEGLFKKYENVKDLDIRVRRLEDRDRFGCDRQARRHQNQQEGEQYEKLNRKLKQIEEKITKLKDSNYENNKFSSNLNYNQVSNMIQEHTQHRVKKVEKKMKKYFTTKFQQIQHLMRKTKKNRSKSPKVRTPIEMSTISQYQIDQSVKPLSQFRLEDYESGKVSVSHLLKDSKNTTVSNKYKSNKICEDIKKKSKKNKKDEHSKSRSKSKSKSQRKEKQKSRDKKLRKTKTNKQNIHSVSRSRSRDISYTQNLSQHSFLHSSCSKSNISRSKSNLSRSKSNLSRSKSNLSKDMSIKPKQKNKSKKMLSISHSKSKSNHSCSPSLHQKCKRRPQHQKLPTPLHPYSQHLKEQPKGKSLREKRRKN